MKIRGLSLICAFHPKKTKYSLKKYVKYIAVLVIVVFSGFILNDTLESLKIDKQLSARIPVADTKEEQPVLIVNKEKFAR